MSAMKSLLGRAAALLGGLALAGSLALAAAAPAEAHDQVVHQTPAAGEHFATSPQEVVLTFTGKPVPIGGVIIVVDAHGTTWEQGEVALSDFTATQALRAPLPDGHYQVRWRIVSEDGHPISESYLFSVGDLAGAPPIPELESGEEPIAGLDNENMGEFALDGVEEETVAAGPSPWRTGLLGGAGALAAVAFYALGAAATTRLSNSTRGTES